MLLFIKFFYLVTLPHVVARLADVLGCKDIAPLTDALLRNARTAFRLPNLGAVRR
jgi:hypothetical protein